MGGPAAARGPSGGPGSRAGRDGLVLSIVRAAAEGKEGGGGVRVWGGVGSRRLTGGAADSPLLQGAPRVKLRCQLNIPAAAAALSGGRGTGAGVPSLPTLPEWVSGPGLRHGGAARSGQRGAGSAAGAEAAELRAGARPAVTYKGSSPEECISCG